MEHSIRADNDPIRIAKSFYKKARLGGKKRLHTLGEDYLETVLMLQKKNGMVRVSYAKVTATAFSSLLKKQWAQQPDVMIPEQIGKLRGYTSPAVHKWIRDGKLEAVAYNSSYLIPKDWLIEYLVATVNENRALKSAKHMKLINQCHKEWRSVMIL